MRIMLHFNNNKNPNLGTYAGSKGTFFACRLRSLKCMNYAAELTSAMAKKSIHGLQTIHRI